VLIKCATKVLMTQILNNDTKSEMINNKYDTEETVKTKKKQLSTLTEC